MTSSILLIGLSIILIPVIRAFNELSAINFTDFNGLKSHLNVSFNETLINRRLAHQTSNVSSAIPDHRLWTSKRIKPREPALDPSDSRTNDELKFDQNYFALLNAVNHRPVAQLSSSDSSKVDKSNVNTNNEPTNTTRSLFYYSPETYGKVSHKNHQNTAFSFNWPPTLTQATGLSSVSTPSSLNSVKGSLTNGTYKINPKINYASNEPNKIIAERGHLSIGEDLKSTNGNYNGEYVSEIGPSEAVVGDETSESSESVSETNSPSPNPHLNNVDGNLIQSEVNNVHNNGNINKYYDTGPYLISKSRSKLSQTPVNVDKNGKPLQFPDHLLQQPPLTPSIDYLEEDYESTEAFPDFKNYRPMVKASTVPTATAKYAGSPPYRQLYYNSYYPTRFYGPPYEDDNSPSKSSNNVNSWSGLAGFLLGIIPLGILMASMVPAFVSVPVATAAAGVGRRRRRRSLFHSNHSLHDDPVHDILSQYQMKMLRDADCIKEILCKIAVQGKSQKIGQHFFETTLNMRFNRVYHELGISQVMEAAKKNRCEKVFQCKRN
uniref:Uncharacterized protein n=1 Tax=Tetranychus urticae TaxID=32264 RepID=T1KJN9_TETUR